VAHGGARDAVVARQRDDGRIGVRIPVSGAEALRRPRGRDRGVASRTGRLTGVWVGKAAKIRRLPDPHSWVSFGSRRRSMRGRLTAYVARHQLAWELAMAALTMIYVVLTLLDDEAVRGLPEVLAVLLSAV